MRFKISATIGILMVVLVVAPEVKAYRTPCEAFNICGDVQTGMLSILAGVTSVQTGEEFDVVIQLNGMKPFTNWQSLVQFNSSLLEYVSHSQGTIAGFVRDERLPTEIQNSGEIQTSGSLPSSEPATNGTIVTITFRAKAVGTATISSVNQSVNIPSGNVFTNSADQNVPVAVQGPVSIIITSPPPPPPQPDPEPRPPSGRRPRPTPQPTPPSTPDPQPTPPVPLPPVSPPPSVPPSYVPVPRPAAPVSQDATSTYYITTYNRPTAPRVHSAAPLPASGAGMASVMALSLLSLPVTVRSIRSRKRYEKRP